MSKRRRIAFLVLGAAFTAILLSSSEAVAAPVTLDHKPPISVGNGPGGVAHAEGTDGKALIATANGLDNTASIRKENPDGTFSQLQPDPATGGRPVDVAFVDGTSKIVTANRDTQNATVLQNDGNDVFAPFQTVELSSADAGTIVGVAVKDFDQNGKEDFALITDRGFNVFNQGATGFTEGASIPQDDTAIGKAAEVTGDDNSDMILTTVETGDGPSKAIVFPGDGVGGFGAAQEIASAPSGETFIDLAVDGFNKKLALVSDGSADDRLRVLNMPSGDEFSSSPYAKAPGGNNLSRGDEVSLHHYEPKPPRTLH